LTVSPTESLSQLLLNCSLLSLDLFAILLLFSAHSRESHELLVPFILFEAILLQIHSLIIHSLKKGFNTVGMAVGCIFCLFSLVNSRTEFAEPTDEAERSFANGNFIDDALLMRSGGNIHSFKMLVIYAAIQTFIAALILSTAFTYAFCSLISLWWTWVAIRCFHYFRGLAAYRANSVGQNEYAESPISTQWTRLAASRPQAILSSTAILSTIDLNIIDSATTNFDDLRHYWFIK
jgi:hypothetical protein